MRALWIGALLALSGLSLAGTIRVTSPNAGDFLGKNNTVNITVTGAQRQVRVLVTATGVANPGDQITSQKDFDPDADGKINGSLPLNFADSTPEGDYNITVTATEPGATYNTIDPFGVHVDVNNPRFKDTNPISGAFVRGIVPISVELQEPNVKEWRVQINNGDIPNNSGVSNIFTVNWNTTSIRDDGPQTINIKVEDLAKNTATKNINVTLDRVAPSITVKTPGPSTKIRPNSNIAVAIDVVDQYQHSVDVSAIDVVLRQTDGTYIGRIARQTIKSNGNTLSWSGRIRWSRNMPSQFKMVVTAWDRAGNQAVTQEIALKVS